MTDPTNSEIAAALDELGDLYELDGAIIHRVVAYRNAAKAVRDASQSVTALARQGRATELPGIGATIQEKVLALADTGEIPAAEKLRAKFPPGLVQITQLPGLGPKRARRLYDELGIDSPRRAACRRGGAQDPRPEGVRREGRGDAARSRAEATAPASAGRRIVLDRALASRRAAASTRCAPTPPPSGSSSPARRGGGPTASRTSTSSRRRPIRSRSHRPRRALQLVETANTPGDRRRQTAHPHGAPSRRADRRARPVRQPAPALHRFQGAQHGAARLRRPQGPARLRVRRARRRRPASPTGARPSRRSTRCSGWQYIEPELRENRGELEAAANGTLPELITVGDLQGDLHCHTTASDGTASIEEMAQAAERRRYEYLAITDHSASMGFGADVSADAAQAPDRA